MRIVRLVGVSLGQVVVSKNIPLPPAARANHILQYRPRGRRLAGTQPGLSKLR
jgi:hypothetical protein